MPGWISLSNERQGSNVLSRNVMVTVARSRLNDAFYNWTIAPFLKEDAFYKRCWKSMAHHHCTGLPDLKHFAPGNFHLFNTTQGKCAALHTIKRLVVKDRSAVAIGVRGLRGCTPNVLRLPIFPNGTKRSNPAIGKMYQSNTHLKFPFLIYRAWLYHWKTNFPSAASPAFAAHLPEWFSQYSGNDALTSAGFPLMQAASKLALLSLNSKHCSYIHFGTEFMHSAKLRIAPTLSFHGITNT